MAPWLSTVLLLIASNVFMFLAWYLHLHLQQTKVISAWPVWLVVIFSWGIALLDYSFQVPANRIGFEGNGGPYSLLQLKVMQEVITLIIFVAMRFMLFSNFSLRWNHLLAFVLLITAVWLVFLK